MQIFSSIWHKIRTASREVLQLGPHLQECEALGMGSFLAVSRASNLGARLIHLTYSPGVKGLDFWIHGGQCLLSDSQICCFCFEAIHLFLLFSRHCNLAWHWTGGEVKRKVGIVGKGLTFDSGGYNLKVGGRYCGKIVVSRGQESRVM